MNIEISDSELQTRHKNGKTIICRSCKDNRGKNVLLSYDRNGNSGLEFGFCNDCLKLMGQCVPCSVKKQK